MDLSDDYDPNDVVDFNPDELIMPEPEQQDIDRLEPVVQARSDVPELEEFRFEDFRGPEMGECVPPTAQRAGREQVRFYPIPIFTGAAMQNAPIRKLDAALQRAFGGNANQKAMATCMARRWVYVFPAQATRKATEDTPARPESSGLLLWDPLYEYTHALCRTADNVDAFAQVLRANIDDPRKRPFVYFVGANAGVKLLWQGALNNEFMENVGSVIARRKDRRVQTIGRGMESANEEAVDNRIFDLLGRDPLVSAFLETFSSETARCKSLADAFRRPNSDALTCNVRGKWITKAPAGQKPKEFATQTFIDLVVRQAQALLNDQRAMEAYQRRVGAVREWTGNRETVCGEESFGKSLARAEERAARKGVPMGRKSVAPRQPVSEQARRMMESLPEVGEGAERSDVREPPGRKRRTGEARPTTPVQSPVFVANDDRESSPPVVAEFPPTPPFAEPMVEDEDELDDDELVDEKECFVRQVELRQAYERLAREQEDAEVVNVVRFGDLPVVTEIVRLYPKYLRPDRGLLTLLLQFMWDCGSERVPNIRQWESEDVWANVRIHFNLDEEDESLRRIVVRLWNDLLAAARNRREERRRQQRLRPK